MNSPARMTWRLGVLLGSLGLISMTMYARIWTEYREARKRREWAEQLDRIAAWK